MQVQSEPARTLQKSIAFILQKEKKNSCRFYQQEKVFGIVAVGKTLESPRGGGGGEDMRDNDFGM